MKIAVRVKGMDTLKRWCVIIPKSVEGTAKDAQNVILDHAATRAVLNAPILEGPLRRGIRRTAVRSENGKIQSAVYVRKGIKYAMRRHEEIYNLGPVSRRQPGTVEGGVGRKYISRVFQFHKNKYDVLMIKAMKQMVEQKAEQLLKGFKAKIPSIR
jgi:hypothetical protein